MSDAGPDYLPPLRKVPPDVGAVARVLREYRSGRGLTQNGVAMALNVTRTSVTNFEAGRQDMPLSKVLAYAELVGVRMVLIPKEFLR